MSKVREITICHASEIREVNKTSTYCPWSTCIIDRGLRSRRNQMRDHSSYTPAVLKTCKELYNLKCQFIRKWNKITIITALLSTLVIKSRYKYIGNVDELKYFKICTGWIIFEICLKFFYPAVYFSKVPRTCLSRRASCQTAIRLFWTADLLKGF